MKVVWIKGFEGRYQISDNGTVLSHRRGKVAERKPSKNNKGYLFVGLGEKNFTIHRLVAMHFVSGCKPGMTVNHKNFIKTDNRAENLEWLTNEENIEYSRINERPAWKRAKPVIGTHIESGRAVEFHSCAAAGKFIECDGSNISQCCNGKMKSVRGYRWQYATAETINKGDGV